MTIFWTIFFPRFALANNRAKKTMAGVRGGSSPPAGVWGQSPQGFDQGDGVGGAHGFHGFT